jgi:hypothetical protein
MGLGLVCLALGLAGHLAAAMAEGGHAIHYGHHIVGFIVLSLATAVIALIFERRFWRWRRDLTILIVGLLQTVFGWSIYMGSSGNRVGGFRGDFTPVGWKHGRNGHQRSGRTPTETARFVRLRSLRQCSYSQALWLA